MSNGVIVKKYLHKNPWKQVYRDGIVQAMRRSSSNRNAQSTIRYTEDNLRLVLRILSVLIVTSLLHFHDQTLTVWIEIERIAIGNSEEHLTHHPTHSAVWKGTFNLLLHGGILFQKFIGIIYTVHWYWLTTLLPLVAFSTKRSHCGEELMSEDNPQRLLQPVNMSTLGQSPRGCLLG